MFIQGKDADAPDHDRMVIYIPTYKREDAQHTWKALPDVWRRQTILVAPERDVNGLKFYVPAAHILVQPVDIKTIAKKRAWIIQQARSPSFLMADDDLVFSVRKDSKGPALRPAEKNDAALIEVFEDLEFRLQKYAHAGISCRQGNNRTEYGWHDVRRMMYLFGFNTKLAQEHLEFDRVGCREDMDYCLQLLRKGYANTVAFHVAVDQKGFGMAGGCSDERTIEYSNNQAEVLAALHPGFVKVVDKDYSASVPRKEVVVQWKKAYESAMGGPRDAA